MSMSSMSSLSDFKRRRNSNASSVNVTYKVEGRLKVTFTTDLASPILCCQFSHDGKFAAFGCSNGEIKVYLTNGNRHVFTLTPETEKKMPATSIRFNKQEGSELYVLYATYSSGHLRSWYITSKLLAKEVNLNTELFCCDLNCTYEKVAVGCDDNSIRVFDAEKLEHMMTLARSETMEKMDGHASRIFAVKYHPDNANILLSAGWDNTIQIWDDRTQRAVRRIYGAHVCGDALDMDPYYNHVITGSWRRENSLQIWNFHNGSLIKTVPLYNANEKSICHLYSAKWGGTDFIICGGSDRNTLRVIEKVNLQTVGMLDSLKSGVYTSDYTEVNNVPIIICGSGNSLFFLSLLT